MKHLGNIVEINGAEIEPVDCIIGGSPCQDLSVAGKRAGLDGKRSGLFMEQVRIVKEMREHDKSCGRTDVTARPRWMVWENVPGALSSGTPKGEDFRIVLEEIARIADSTAVIPRPEKWSKSGCIMGDRWSIAWRVHDAQFWGVPQRRNRISLVADFAGGGAAEVLFERKSMFRDSEESGETRKRTAEGSEGCADASSFTLKIRGGREVDSLGKRAGKGALVQTELSATLGVSQDQTLVTTVYGISPYDSNAMKSNNPHSGIYEADTSRALDNNGGSPACNQGGMVVLEGNGSRPSHLGDGYVESETMYTLNSAERHAVAVNETIPLESNHTDGRVKIAKDGVVQTLKERMGTGGNNVPLLLTMQAFGKYAETGVAPSQKQRDYKDATDLVIETNTHQKNTLSIDEKMGQTYIHEDIGNTLSARDYKQPQAVMLQDTTGTLSPGTHPGSYNGQENDMLVSSPVVRRLTPTECERLQGFPDGWTDIGEWEENGKEHKESSDSSRYKALGNSIALPYWRWLIKRISATYPRNPTLGSLFDGIGGFCLCWERTNGVGTARWASEIEPFCIAVTKKHFGDGEKEGDIRKYL